MSTSICLPAHILDAAITPRAREVLMLLASQTSVKNPTLWICQAAIAARLRCSVATVARSIKALVEAKLIADTGRLHEGRYKIYHVRWSAEENIKAVSKKITQPVRKLAQAKTRKAAPRPVPTPKRIPVPVEGIQLILPPVAEVEAPPPQTATQSGPSTITPQSILKDSRLAYWADYAHQKHQESLRLHKAILAQLR